MEVIYKTLVEVMVLHEFYLTDDEGTTIFLTPDQPGKIAFLTKNATAGLPSVTDDLAFEVADSGQSSFSNFHLRLVPAYSGFRILIEVLKKNLADGTTVYEPRIPLPDDLNINVMLVKNNSLLDTISNTRMRKNIPAINYFSNSETLAAKTAPSLSNNIPDYDSSFAYEFGELAVDSGTLHQYIIPLDSTTNSPWKPVAGDTSYVNENDRLLVPVRFNYSFDPSDNVTQVNFTLQNGSTNLTPTISFTSENPLQKVELDFSLLTPVKVEPLSYKVVPVIYTLLVSGSNGYAKQFRLIFFDDELKIKSSWGLVNIQPGVTTTAFNLLDDAGHLLTQVSSTGKIVDAPKFEIRIKSRPAYWRYTNDNSQTFDVSSIPTNLLTSVNNGANLITVDPRTTTYTPTLFETGSNTFENLPNPHPGTLVAVENGQFFKDIIVPESEMFPVEVT